MKGLEFRLCKLRRTSMKQRHEDVIPSPHLSVPIPKGPCRYMEYTWALK